MMMRPPAAGYSYPPPGARPPMQPQGQLSAGGNLSGPQRLVSQGMPGPADSRPGMQAPQMALQMPMRPPFGTMPGPMMTAQPLGSQQRPTIYSSPGQAAGPMPVPSGRPMMTSQPMSQPMPQQQQAPVLSAQHAPVFSSQQAPVFAKQQAPVPQYAPVHTMQQVPMATAASIPAGAHSSSAAFNMGNPDYEKFEYMVGDKVRLRGQAGNPAYEGKSYTVEVPDDGNGAVVVCHKLKENAVSRMTFNKCFLELVEEAGAQQEDVTDGQAEGGEAAVDNATQEPATFEEETKELNFGDVVVIMDLDACPKHNGRRCVVQMVDGLKKVVRVKFEDGNDMLELAPSYLQLVEKVAPAQSSTARTPDGGEGAAWPAEGPQKGDMVRILAPPQHRGKLATVEAHDPASGNMRVRLAEPSDTVTMLVVGPTHVENLDGSPVHGAAEAEAALSAQADALRQAAMPPPPSANAVLPLCVAPGDMVRVKATLPSYCGQVGCIEAADDGAGSAIIKLQVANGSATRLRISPVHLEPI
ncbi:unnamed protein product [Polarella glacialis]|uniref:Uncharacterized protein n=1 Tax=Polarella glacialis TaxID=89957 RepID=A0A813IU54_POLGL|nr:unnamed protein product [Polarella glacialis]